MGSPHDDRRTASTRADKTHLAFVQTRIDFEVVRHCHPNDAVWAAASRLPGCARWRPVVLSQVCFDAVRGLKRCPEGCRASCLDPPAAALGPVAWLRTVPAQCSDACQVSVKAPAGAHIVRLSRIKSRLVPGARASPCHGCPNASPVVLTAQHPDTPRTSEVPSAPDVDTEA